jgi:hypothetical protein
MEHPAMARLNDTSAIVASGNEKERWERERFGWWAESGSRSSPDLNRAYTGRMKQRDKEYQRLGIGLEQQQPLPRNPDAGNESLRSATMFLKRGKL